MTAPTASPARMPPSATSTASATSTTSATSTARTTRGATPEGTAAPTPDGTTGATPTAPTAAPTTGTTLATAATTDGAADSSAERRGARIGVVTFPGSLDDRDAQRAVRLAGGTPVALWHADADLHGVAAVVLPGGFSYGDYLRAGAIARFAPLMRRVVDAARGGLPVLGICNGFQILCESHLLPGALIRNDHRKFVCRDQALQVESNRTAWTSAYDEGQRIVVPLKNGEGGYVADARTLDALEAEGRVVLRYLGDNPNGSYRAIAGITDATGTVVGVMPHPEHAVEPLTGPGTDGLGFFASVLARLVAA